MAVVGKCITSTFSRILMDKHIFRIIITCFIHVEGWAVMVLQLALPFVFTVNMAEPSPVNVPCPYCCPLSFFPTIFTSSMIFFITV